MDNGIVSLGGDKFRDSRHENPVGSLSRGTAGSWGVW